jgi:hypothetical protein
MRAMENPSPQYEARCLRSISRKINGARIHRIAKSKLLPGPAAALRELLRTAGPGFVSRQTLTHDTGSQS